MIIIELISLILNYTIIRYAYKRWQTANPLVYRHSGDDMSVDAANLDSDGELSVNKQPGATPAGTTAAAAPALPPATVQTPQQPPVRLVERCSIWVWHLGVAFGCSMGVPFGCRIWVPYQIISIK